MDTAANNGVLLPGIKSASPLTPLQLNNIRLDVKHTLLTPDYLENLSKQEDSSSDAATVSAQ